MQLRHRVALDGVQLDSVDSRIMISKIETGEGRENISTVSLMGFSGSRVTGEHRDSLDITVKFRIRLKKRDMAERETVIEKVNAWAFAGGWLTTNYKPNRRIRVFRAQAASAGDPWEWTKEYAIVFRACGLPYWQTETPAAVMRLDTASESMTLGAEGSEKSDLDVSFQNTSGGTVNTLSLSTEDGSMSFTSLGLANGETLVIDHQDSGKKRLQRIRIRSTAGIYRSAMAKRTPASSNELTVHPGANQITMSAGGSGKIQISCYGRFA